MTIWTSFANYLLPMAFISMLLICIPFPLKINKFIINNLVNVANIKIPYTKFTIIQSLLSISLIMFIVSIFNLIKYKNKEYSSSSILGVNQYALKWRSERNFWICCCNLLIYSSTYIILSLKYKIIEYEHQKNSKNSSGPNILPKNINSNLRKRTKYPGDLLSR